MSRPARNRRDTTCRAMQQLGATAAVAGLGLLATACSSGSANSGTGAGAPIPAISVAIAAPTTTDAALFVAEQKGFFTEYHVNVKIVVDGGDGGTDLVAGRVTINDGGATESFTAIADGKPMKLIYANDVSDITGGVVVKASSPYKTIYSLAGQKVGVIGLGSSYGSAEFLSSEVTKAGDKPLDVVSLTSLGAVTAELASGQIAAAVGPLDFFPAELQDKTVRVLVNPASATDNALLGGHIIPSAATILATTLTKDKTAVTRFLAGMAKATAYVSQATPAAIASILVTNKDFDDYTEAELAATEALDKAYVPNDKGLITPQQWAESLNAFAKWKLPVNVHGSEFSYKTLIDMGPLQAGIKLANS